MGLQSADLQITLAYSDLIEHLNHAYPINVISNNKLYTVQDTNPLPKSIQVIQPLTQHDITGIIQTKNMLLRNYADDRRSDSRYRKALDRMIKLLGTNDLNLINKGLNTTYLQLVAEMDTSSCQENHLLLKPNFAYC